MYYTIQYFYYNKASNELPDMNGFMVFEMRVTWYLERENEYSI